MSNMFMALRIPRDNNSSPYSTNTNILTRNIDSNKIYPFMCQYIIGSRKPCRVLTKPLSELKKVNNVTGGSTSTVDSSFTNKQRYSHYSKNTQRYASNVSIFNSPDIRNLQSIQAYANTIELFFTANTSSYTIYTITVTDLFINSIVQVQTFKNTNRYIINNLEPSTEYNISLVATDYLGQQTTISLNKSTTDIPVDEAIYIPFIPYIPPEFFDDLISFGND